MSFKQNVSPWGMVFLIIAAALIMGALAYGAHLREQVQAQQQEAASRAIQKRKEREDICKQKPNIPYCQLQRQAQGQIK